MRATALLPPDMRISSRSTQGSIRKVLTYLMDGFTKWSNESGSNDMGDADSDLKQCFVVACSKLTRKNNQ